MESSRRRRRLRSFMSAALTTMRWSQVDSRAAPANECDRLEGREECLLYRVAGIFFGSDQAARGRQHPAPVLAGPRSRRPRGRRREAARRARSRPPPGPPRTSTPSLSGRARGASRRRSRSSPPSRVPLRSSSRSRAMPAESRNWTPETSRQIAPSPLSAGRQRHAAPGRTRWVRRPSTRSVSIPSSAVTLVTRIMMRVTNRKPCAASLARRDHRKVLVGREVGREDSPRRRREPAATFRGSTRDPRRSAGYRASAFGCGACSGSGRAGAPLPAARRCASRSA